MEAEGLRQWSVPMTTSRIEPAASRLVAKCQKQLRHHFGQLNSGINTSLILKRFDSSKPRMTADYVDLQLWQFIRADLGFWRLLFLKCWHWTATNAQQGTIVASFILRRCLGILVERLSKTSVGIVFAWSKLERGVLWNTVVLEPACLVTATVIRRKNAWGRPQWEQRTAERITTKLSHSVCNLDLIRPFPHPTPFLHPITILQTPFMLWLLHSP